MKYLSRNDIEGISRRVVSAYMKLPQFSGKPVYRIDPEILIKDLLGLNIAYHHLSEDCSILGVTAPATIGIKIFDNKDGEDYYFLDGKTVLIERDLRDDKMQKGRCNFTLVHEASHQIFKMLFPKEYGANVCNRLHFCLSQSATKPIIDWEEWQTNVLTSYILLPEHIVKKAMLLFSLGERIGVLNRIYSPTIYSRFSDMASFLGVSKKALSIRLSQLNLIENNYFDNPYSFINISVEEDINNAQNKY